jgi:hypothetical protein
MISALPRRAAWLVWSLAAGACYDVTKVPLPPLIVDNFDDGDDKPRTDRFLPWTCRTVRNSTDGPGAPPGADGGAPDLQCQVGPVGTHEFAITLPFVVDDPPDGQRQLGGAEIATQASQPGADFGAFRQLVLSAILESGTPGLPAGTQLRVEIRCALGGTTRTLDQVVPGLAIDADWQNFPLDLANFAPPLPGCLDQVESLHFSVRPGLPDGQSARGALHLDNIYLQ